MELYNWGTFDNEVVKIEPQGNNSLLTGANGSGKTTFVDALLTLLVPLKRDRFYNQSSGSEKKGDRTEDTYVRGDYGKIQKEGLTKLTRQTLRSNSTYSILLASFANTDGKIVTLFQLRWYSGDIMRRCFGIARVPLRIDKDFPEFDFNGLWQSRLEQQYNTNTQKSKIDFYDDQPGKYAKKITSLFGMRSLKALKLFNQALGIKVLEDLDGFIRENMLEDENPEAKYIELNASFITLRSAKVKIDKTKEQLLRLEPINDIATKISDSKEELAELVKTRDTSVLWFSTKGKEVYLEEKDNLEKQNGLVTDQIKTLEKEAIQIVNDLGILNSQIQNDAVSAQIDKLTNDIVVLAEKRDDRQTKLDSYNTVARGLNLAQNPDETKFSSNLTSATTLVSNSETERTQLLKKEIALEETITRTGVEMTKTSEAIKTLRENGNNISPRAAKIRDGILKHIGVSRYEIPFIGELIKIADGEDEWQGSIEKLLHSFAMRLIVPEQYYEAVNQYVNNTDLKGKITYLRFKETASLKNMELSIPDSNYVLGKLDFKSDSPYSDFIESKVKERYNFLCTNDPQQFKKASRAVMIKGLIKRGNGNHEKDDRQHINAKSNYVLGWDNTKKLSNLKEDFEQLKANQGEAVNAKKELTQKLKSLKLQLDNLYKLTEGYLKFDVINWKKYALEIEEIKKTISSLEGNEKAIAFQKEKDRLESKSTTNKEQQKLSNEEHFNLKRDIKTVSTGIVNFDNLISQLDDENADLENFDTNKPLLETISFENFDRIREKFQRENLSDITALEKAISKYREKVVSKISYFINPNKETLELFPDWGSDTGELTTNLDHLYVYQNLYKKLKTDGLPTFQDRFDKYLEETLVDKIGAFNFYFEQWQEHIKKTIETLNKSLFAIDFDSEPNRTYIKLMQRLQVKEQAGIFRKLLHNALPNVSETMTIEDKREHFEESISPLLAKLEDSAWRKKVLDVREWFDFKVEKYSREDDSKGKTYDGMGQLSGGQKAQLTYTILGSAIAYQFGLTSQGLESNSFRFIAIDEAFKAQDDEKSKYLLELCKQLHLQILVVTPSDGIEIVEPYISYVHFTEIENEQQSSLYDMTIEKFREEKERLLEDNDNS